VVALLVLVSVVLDTEAFDSGLLAAGISVGFLTPVGEDTTELGGGGVEVFEIDGDLGEVGCLPEVGVVTVLEIGDVVDLGSPGGT